MMQPDIARLCLHLPMLHTVYGSEWLEERTLEAVAKTSATTTALLPLFEGLIRNGFPRYYILWCQCICYACGRGCDLSSRHGGSFPCHLCHSCWCRLLDGSSALNSCGVRHSLSLPRCPCNLLRGRSRLGLGHHAVRGAACVCLRRCLG